MAVKKVSKADSILRLDRALFDGKYVTSRSYAQKIITEGHVFVNGVNILNPAKKIKEEDILTIKEYKKYLSRGYLKIEAAIRNFGIGVRNLKCLDIGSSTGGFTQFLLEEGALSITCVDVGSEQLHPSLRSEKKVSLYENTDIRKFNSGEEVFDIVTVDVSFISLTKIIPELSRFVRKGSRVVLLVKPQFEVGKGNTKKGIVTDPNLRHLCLQNIKDVLEDQGFSLLGEMESPVLGGDGNMEYLLCASY